MTGAEADLAHPLVEIAQRMMRPAPGGGWVFEAKDAEILEAAIVQERNDPRLAGAILGLFEVAAQLHENHGSPAAAGALLAVLGRVAGRLPLSPAVQEAAREWSRKFGGGGGERPLAPREGEKASGGTPLTDLIQSSKRKLR